MNLIVCDTARRLHPRPVEQRRGAEDLRRADAQRWSRTLQRLQQGQLNPEDAAIVIQSLQEHPGAPEAAVIAANKIIQARQAALAAAQAQPAQPGQPELPAAQPGMALPGEPGAVPSTGPPPGMPAGGPPGGGPPLNPASLIAALQAAPKQGAAA
jgi:hypothetical protein